MRFEELRFGDCPHCGFQHLQFSVVWTNQHVKAVARAGRPWAAIACPRCGGVTALEMSPTGTLQSPGADIPDQTWVSLVARYPEGDAARLRIDHLPDSIGTYFANAQRVLAAGVNSSAAVELRRTLEAATNHFNAGGNKPLFQQIKKLIDDGLVTRQFGEALTYVRKIGNAGAHAGEEVLSDRDLQACMRFTELLLRNLFEVPGALAELQDEASESDEEIEGRTAG